MADQALGRASGGAARGMAVTPAVAAIVVLPLAIAMTDRHMEGQPWTLVTSTATGALAVSALALQPFLAARARAAVRPSGARRRLRLHRALGAAALTLVLAHVAALFLLEADDAWFALSPDGPTRARMALMATIALVAVVALGALRDHLPFAALTWRLLHAYLATLALVLGIGHAVLTDGALDGVGTPVLLASGALGVAGVGLARLRAGPDRDRRVDL